MFVYNTYNIISFSISLHYLQNEINVFDTFTIVIVIKILIKISFFSGSK